MGPLYTCLIVDDEKPAHLVLKSHIANCSELVFSASVYNGKEAIEILSKQSFDIVFLDIDMPLINGIEFMQTISDLPAIIITTAYIDFAFESYQNDAVDYLLKPVSFQRFVKSIEKAKRFCNIGNEKYTNTITLKIDGISKILTSNEIVFIKSFGNYIKIFLSDKDAPITVYSSLKNILDSNSTNCLVQIHKSFIINVNYIKNIEMYNVILQNNFSVPIGRKFQILLNEYKKF